MVRAHQRAHGGHALGGRQDARLDGAPIVVRQAEVQRLWVHAPIMLPEVGMRVGTD
ncbi:hypothetical protein D3C78_1665990 [compost metagenome]